MTNKQKEKYEKDLDKMSDLTLELLEQYMSVSDLDDALQNDPSLNRDSFFWSGGNLGPEDPDQKSYEEWLKYYGIEDDDDEEE
jgi:hypothetical protein